MCVYPRRILPATIEQSAVATQSQTSHAMPRWTSVVFFACGDLCGGVWHASAGVVQVVWRMNVTVRSAARCAHARRSSNDTARRSSIGTPEDAGAIADTESIAGSRYSRTIVPQTGPGRRVSCVVCVCVELEGHKQGQGGGLERHEGQGAGRVSV